MTDKQFAVDWLRNFSIETWNRIGFTRFNGRGKLYEVTLTQNLIFQLYYQCSSNSLPFELWESKDEKTNGNDLEIFVETPHGYLSFPCQAKIVNKQGRYNTINHQTQGKFQIEALQQYARQQKGIPIYMLYNHIDDTHFISRTWPNQYEKLASYGCSIVSADYLFQEYFSIHSLTGSKKWWRIPALNDLIPTHSMPLHKFIEMLLNHGTMHLSGLQETQSKALFHSISSIFEKTNWKNLTPLPQLSGIALEKDWEYYETELNTVSTFSPRFRFIISQEKRRSTLSIVQ